MERTFFQCVLCAAGLRESSPELFSCIVCGASYPVVGGVKVMVLNPTGLLLAQQDQVTEDPSLAKRHDEFRRRLEQEGISHQSLSGLDSALGVWLANQRVFRDKFVRAEEYLESHRGEEGLLALFTSYPTGWPLDRYVSYFYRDWHGTAEARSIAKLFRDAISRYGRVGSERVAVLGCGAAGLLRDLSELFERSFGLDISVPDLLLAKHLLEGGATTLEYNFPNDLFPKQQSQVRVSGVERPENISLVAANVTNMPFPSESISCVVTQYLFDLMNDQSSVAAEIHRVLVPDGLWINFGLPSCQTAFDIVTHLDLPSFLERSGFATCDVEIQRCSQLDLTSVSELASTIIQSHVFFAARRSERSRQPAGSSFFEYFSGREGPLLGSTPRLSDRFVFSIGRERRFNSSGVEEGHVLEIRSVSTAWQSFQNPLRAPIPEPAAQFLELVLSAMDGSRTVAELMNVIQSKIGTVVTRREIAVFLRALQDSAFALVV